MLTTGNLIFIVHTEDFNLFKDIVSRRFVIFVLSCSFCLYDFKNIISVASGKGRSLLTITASWLLNCMISVILLIVIMKTKLLLLCRRLPFAIFTYYVLMLFSHTVVNTRKVYATVIQSSILGL